MTWVLFAFIPVVIDAFANIVDGHFSNTKFKDPWALFFYLGIIQLVFAPLILLYDRPTLVPWSTATLFGLVSILDFFCIFFYFKALREDDTSIVTSLFSLGKIAVPFLAFFIVGERLAWPQYLGFIIVVTCATVLTASRRSGKLTLNKAFFFMAAASLFSSLDSVIYKLALGEVKWVTGFVYTALFSGLIYLAIFIFKNKTIVEHFTSFRQNWRLMTLESALGFVSVAAGTIAISLAPVTLVKSIYATQPLLVLAYTPLIKRYFKINIRENQSIIKKVVCFLIILAALWLVVGK